jgi:hypothetical protein
MTGTSQGKKPHEELTHDARWGFLAAVGKVHVSVLRSTSDPALRAGLRGPLSQIQEVYAETEALSQVEGKSDHET